MYYTAFWFLAVVCSISTIHQQLRNKPAGKEPLDEDTRDVTAFKRKYLLVYLLNVTADWLQGPYVYDLYRSYGYDVHDIAILFVVGFLSSAVFGTFVGSLADQMGRKRFSILYSILYSVSCLTKLSPYFGILLLGRVTGGISTSLLFSVFESWMVSEHKTRGFSQASLAATFSLATLGNGVVAILAGLMADSVAKPYGPVAPFMLSIVFLVISGFIVQLTWNENFGQESGSSTSYTNSLSEGFKVVRSNFNIFAVGMVQSLFESAMYSFVFIWSPALEQASASTERLPYGIIFGSFMICLMLGSNLFQFFSTNYFQTPEKILRSVLFFSGIIFLVCSFFSTSETTLFILFNLFELACGCYFPAIGIIRSKVIPEETRSTIMNLFRIPLNLIVVLLLSNIKAYSISFVLIVCSLLLWSSFILLSMIKNS